MASEPAIPIDAPVLPLAELAEQVADRLAGRLAAQLVELARTGAFESVQSGVQRSAGVRRPAAEGQSPPSEDGWWTAARVAAHYDVGVRFVYQHADELGCVRLGGGRRPRLRFDPTVVARCWSSVGDTLPQTSPARRRRRRAAPQAEVTGNDYELIEFDWNP
jgi:hypothetical protein